MLGLGCLLRCQHMGSFPLDLRPERIRKLRKPLGKEHHCLDSPFQDLQQTVAQQRLLLRLDLLRLVVVRLLHQLLRYLLVGRMPVEKKPWFHQSLVSCPVAVQKQNRLHQNQQLLLDKTGRSFIQLQPLLLVHEGSRSEPA